MENTTTPAFKQPCVVNVYRGIPIKNNEYKQYVKLDENTLDLIRQKCINLTFQKKII